MPSQQYSSNLSLVAAHAEMVYEECACGFGLRAGVEGSAEGGEDGADVFVQVTDFTDDRSCEFGGIWWEVR
jgi:hypothetical protein